MNLVQQVLHQQGYAAAAFDFGIAIRFNYCATPCNLLPLVLVAALQERWESVSASTRIEFRFGWRSRTSLMVFPEALHI